MKRAVIVVGPHYAGKSKTINKYFKPMLNIRPRAHKFTLNGTKGMVLSQSREEAVHRCGFVRSQSLEESRRTPFGVTRLIRTNAHFNFLVLAARPSNESISFLVQLKSVLRRNQYRVFLVRVAAKHPEQFYIERARKILRYLLG